MVHTGTSNVGEKIMKQYTLMQVHQQNQYLQLNAGHELANGESIRIIADNGDLPENIDPHTVYFAITSTQDSALGSKSNSYSIIKNKR